MKLAPLMPLQHFETGKTLARDGRLSEACDAFRQATQLDPSLIGAWVNLCVLSKNLGRVGEAEYAIAAAFTHSGQTADFSEEAEHIYNVLHWHLALLELAKGNLHEGFALFRSRFHGGTNWQRFESPKPLWRGEDLNGKTILITAEQGHGDMLMMARYLPLLKQKGAKIIFQTHPALVDYFTGWDFVDHVVSVREPIRMDFDYHAPIFDLPYRFGTDTQTIPAAVPYLPVAKNSNPLNSAKRKIGIVWAGQKDNPRDHLRSLKLVDILPLFSAPDTQFYNLTRERSDSDATLLAEYGVIDLTADLHNFAASAGFINQMDLVISCDTATAHLAGGLGKPVYVALPFAPDWRWGYERSDSPWYPTMRLFRQPHIGDWTPVVSDIKSAITKA
jgi:hypothetical protein